MNVLPLSQLIEPLQEALPAVERHGPDVAVSGLCSDSRAVVKGDLFIAGIGTRDDGLAHVEEALAKGAVAVLAARRPVGINGTACITVGDVPLAKALVANAFFGHPSRRLDTIGVTGTNGKTTTTFMLRSILTMDGRGTGLVGTLGAWIGGRHEPLRHTTPDAIELQRLLARMVDENLAAAVMEVSSHALMQRRAHGIAFDAAIFTNLTPDHLDYHGTMEAYAAAKGRLFEELSESAVAVLNADDPASRLYRLSTPARVLTFGLSTQADVTARISRLDGDGTRLLLVAPELGPPIDIHLRLIGRHNVMNALGAATAALALGLPASAVATGLESLPAVPGRLEPVCCGQDFRVLVDYAHTPDALEKVLDLLRPLTLGALRVVFGCGGDRDRTTRPVMGRAVAARADALYVTSDNPRSEDPEAILDEVLAGIPLERRGATVREVDRREAIRRACAESRPGDVLLIAGKGHETTQTIGARVLPFDDRAVAREVLWSL
ncbi:MAG TPA: UDP-N-acetylmuramoyl-L-alanyl-D-glutamate--2,6-diaminopimelate ligase [Planctomycetota bacterium]|nr:UDP-N-acetylmuramoyl-L-alanyl-D-glutamate--2,6-diaminopimelate ligase [Planctomycetota bacterium]